MSVSLTEHNTLRLRSEARAFSTFRCLADVQALHQRAMAENLPLKVLGGGSNVLMPAHVEALVIQANSQQVTFVRSEEQHCWVDVDAGMSWHDWVLRSLEYGHGLENLALIPGSVGASPIQNIGAYGVEVGEYLESVTGYQLSTQQYRTLSAHECRFGYRDSIFKRELRDDFVILRVRFKLTKTFSPCLNYAPLNQLDAATVTPQSLIQAVIDTRQSKLPDPAETPNAGSFFKNPVVSEALADALSATHPELPRYAQPEGVKLAAGWLIDQAGFRGKRLGPVAMYEKQALVLTAPEAASLDDVIALQRAVQDEVYARFGVMLEPEPQLFL